MEIFKENRCFAYSFTYVYNGKILKTRTLRTADPKRTGFISVSRLCAEAGTAGNRRRHALLLLIVGVSGENVIGVENGYHDQRCESCGKTAVKKDESTMHTCCG